MTQQPYAPPPQQYAPPPQQQYAPPPQQQYAPPPQQYAPPPQQQAYYPPPQQQYPPQAVPPPVQGTLDDFYNQPSSGGGPSLKFEQVGTRYVGVVTRPIGPGDVQQQTNTQGIPQTFKDGRPKWVMKVPLQMQPSPAYPDGLAQWYVKGAARDELVRAMTEAGVNEGAPEAGAIIDVTFTSTRSAGVGMNPAKLFHVVYTPPGQQPGQQPAQAQQQAPQGAVAPSPAPAPQAPQQAPQPVQQPQYAPQQAPQPVEQPQYAPPPPQAQAQQQYAPPPPAQQYAPPPAQPAPPADLSPEQQQLLARLTGGQG